MTYYSTSLFSSFFQNFKKFGIFFTSTVNCMIHSIYYSSEWARLDGHINKYVRVQFGPFLQVGVVPITSKHVCKQFRKQCLALTTRPCTGYCPVLFTYMPHINTQESNHQAVPITSKHESKQFRKQYLALTTRPCTGYCPVLLTYLPHINTQEANNQGKRLKYGSLSNFSVL